MRRNFVGFVNAVYTRNYPFPFSNAAHKYEKAVGRSMDALCNKI